jgi:hypothetical protein
MKLSIFSFSLVEFVRGPHAAGVLSITGLDWRDKSSSWTDVAV